MSSTDPLTEAREALRSVLGYAQREEYARRTVDAANVLARLDALPAPIRCEHLKDNMPLFTGWGYPDAEAAS